MFIDNSTLAYVNNDIRSLNKLIRKNISAPDLQLEIYSLRCRASIFKMMRTDYNNIDS